MMKERLNAAALMDLESMDGQELFTRALFTKAWFNELTVDELKQYIAAGGDVNYQNKNFGATVLMWTAGHGQTELTQMLLDANADVNMQANDGLTALHRAALCNFSATIAQLIKAGADVNMQDNDGWTALHYAAYYNHPAVIAQLIKAGADVNMQDNDGYAALHRALNNGHMACALLLLDAKANLWPASVDGETPMSFGLLHHHSNDDMMRVLLEHGTCQDTRFTAVMEASRLGYASAMKKLLALGAYVYEKDKYGTTALDVASSEECAMLLRTMMSDPLPPPPESPEPEVLDEETIVSNAGDNELTVDELKQCIAAGKDVNYQDQYGNTALMWTAYHGRTELIQILLDANADVNMHHIDGQAALHYATTTNQPAVIAQLIKAGADVNMQDNDGYAALHRALNYAHIACTLLLLDAKANVWLENVDGETPVSFALQYEYADDDMMRLLCDDMMRLLLEHGTCQDTGFTALMEASRLGYVFAVKKLLALGANVYEKDKYGTTALDVTSSEECTMLLRMMMPDPLPPPPESH